MDSSLVTGVAVVVLSIVSVLAIVLALVALRLVRRHTRRGKDCAVRSPL